MLVLVAFVVINLRTMIVQDGNTIRVKNLFHTIEVSADSVVAVVPRRTYHSSNALALVCEQAGAPRVLNLKALSVREIGDADIQRRLPFLAKLERPLPS